MHLISQKKIVFISILIITLSPCFLQGNASAIPANYNKVSKTSSVSVDTSILTLQRRINSTIDEVNQSIIVELILTNIGNDPIYNINLTEVTISNPFIITKNLITPMLFAKFEANETRIISYTITSLKATNITLGQASAKFQLSNSPNSPTYLATSKISHIQIIDKKVTRNQENLDNLLVVSVLAVLYTVILILRILFKLAKKSKTST